MAHCVAIIKELDHVTHPLGLEMLKLCFQQLQDYVPRRRRIVHDDALLRSAGYEFLYQMKKAPFISISL